MKGYNHSILGTSDLGSWLFDPMKMNRSGFLHWTTIQLPKKIPSSWHLPISNTGFPRRWQASQESPSLRAPKLPGPAPGAEILKSSRLLDASVAEVAKGRA